MKRERTNMNRCILCGEEITADRVSDEHVVPAAFGGALTDPAILCRGCNSTTGSELDARLENRLRPLLASLRIRNQRTKQLSQPIVYDGGEHGPLRWDMGAGYVTVNKTSFYRDEEGDLIHAVRTVPAGPHIEREFRQFEEQMARKYGRENIVASETTEGFAKAPPLKLSLVLADDVLCLRAVAKIALTYAAHVLKTTPESVNVTEELRRFVNGETPADSLVTDFPGGVIESFASNPAPLPHHVCAVTAAGGSLWCLVALFSPLTFLVKLGPSTGRYRLAAATTILNPTDHTLMAGPARYAADLADLIEGGGAFDSEQRQLEKYFATAVLHILLSQNGTPMLPLPREETPG